MFTRSNAHLSILHSKYISPTNDYHSLKNSWKWNTACSCLEEFKLPHGAMFHFHGFTPIISIGWPPASCNSAWANPACSPRRPSPSSRRRTAKPPVDTSRDVTRRPGRRLAGRPRAKTRNVHIAVLRPFRSDAVPFVASCLLAVMPGATFVASLDVLIS